MADDQFSFGDALRIWAKSQRGKPPLPPHLYHYTSLHAFQEIIRHNTFWMSEIRFLNDSSEMSEFYKLYYEEIDRRYPNSQGTDRQILDALKRYPVDFGTLEKYGLAVFVGCFTEEHDDLSQWRGYCQHGKGISLGFDFQKLSGIVPRAGFVLAKCLYTDADKRELAAWAVDYCIKHVTDRGWIDDDEFLQGLRVDVLLLATIAKNETFIGEKEWRIVSPVWATTFRDDDSNYQFESPPNDLAIRAREGKTTLIPYLELPLPSPKDADGHYRGPRMGERIIVGPSPNIDLSVQGVRIFTSHYWSKHEGSRDQLDRISKSKHFTYREC
jgi:hypothetical protein